MIIIFRFMNNILIFGNTTFQVKNLRMIRVAQIFAYIYSIHCMQSRVVHGSDGPAGRVGSRFCRILAGRVGSGQHFGFFSFLHIISWYLNPYESSNITYGLIDFLRYLIYNN